MTSPFDDGWVPEQVKPPCMVDLRGVAHGPRGYKKKNEERFGIKRKADDMDVAEAAEGTEEIMAVDVPSVRSLKRTKLNIAGAGKVSKRTWKVPGDRMCSLKSDTLKTSWEYKMEQRRVKKEFQEGVKAVKAAYGAKQKALREARQKTEERKEENRKKSAVVQKISNPDTLKKMMASKKQRKKLMMADTN
ncbi:hypothetical protein BSKO_10649 [Bryopsis sp. KO-2023]|nr:hypothetical protein BSKO_10649 [Bryopsis sp. KO-2023]